MKLTSSVTTLLCAAVAVVFSSQSEVVAASKVQSLRGFQFEDQVLFANCDTTQTCNGKGQNSCENLQKDCNLCYWNYQKNKCMPTNSPAPKPTKKPTKKPSSSGNSCQVNKKNQCPSGQWCQTSHYGNCSGTGHCSYFTGDCSGQGSEPVCGCDWNTYKNACEAQAAGVNINHSGSC